MREICSKLTNSINGMIQRQLWRSSNYIINFEQIPRIIWLFFVKVEHNYAYQMDVLKY